MEKKKIPYAIANWEQMIEENGYFVDKTKYLEKLEDYKAPVFLRPRRFGKSLLCSIQECYYDINRKDKFDELFENTYIGQNPTKERNKYMILRLDFSKIEISNDVSKIEERFNHIVKNNIIKFCYKYNNYFKDIDLKTDSISLLLDDVLMRIEMLNLPQMYVIIDEYDNFTNQLITSGKDAVYKKITSGQDESFLKTFFKILKEGIGSRTIRRVYITGVLPITIDDLSSGFNIAKILTLKDDFLSMLGFNQAEVDKYLEDVIKDFKIENVNIESIKGILKNFYDGYRFAVNAEPLYNSTIVTYFLEEFAKTKEIPQFFIDPNLKTDVSWIRRLTVKESNTKEMLEKIIFDGCLPYNQDILTNSFDANTFFTKDFYPCSLFYLGMLTIDDKENMVIPNQTMQSIFTVYYNEVEQYHINQEYNDIFIQFRKDLDINALFAGYWEIYIGQFPAQMFEKANENFFRSTFYELCRRHLSSDFVFEIEVNQHGGRTDLEFLGKHTTQYKDMKYLVEFKHFKNDDASLWRKLDKPRQKDKDQLAIYEKAIAKKFPELTITKWMIYTYKGKGWKVFKIDKNLGTVGATSCGCPQKKGN